MLLSKVVDFRSTELEMFNVALQHHVLNLTTVSFFLFCVINIFTIVLTCKQ